jgi:hypothetical protein
MGKINSRFIRKLCENLDRPNSEQAQLVRDLKDFYHRMGGNALQIFESKLRKFIEEPDTHLGFVSEVTFANQLMCHNVSHSFLPEPGTPTPDIEATILNRKIYFEIKATEEDIYMTFIEDVQEQIEQLALDYHITIRPMYISIGKEDSLALRVTQRIRDALSKGDYRPIQYEDEEGTVYVSFDFKVRVRKRTSSLTAPYFSREISLKCGKLYFYRP